MYTYIYTPVPHLVDRYWTTPLQLYRYLLRHPDERQRIIQHIQEFANGELLLVAICHPLIPCGILRYSTIHTDDDFIRRLEICRDHERYSERVVFRRF
jgi:hypothetical protein